RSAAATTFAPRSCPSRPGFATRTLIGLIERTKLAAAKQERQSGHHSLRATSSISEEVLLSGRSLNPSNACSTIKPAAAKSSDSLVAVYSLSLCSRVPVRDPRLQFERTVNIPDSGSNSRSCANRDLPEVHQSRARNRAMTPSLLAPCQIISPPGFNTRANSLVTC